jgi:ABC-type multidrug transport system fused ATPase/permease subunit
MLANVNQSLLLLDPRERLLIVALTASRALLGLLDIAGIFLIGLLLAKATNQLTNNSYNNETLDLVSNIAGNLSLIQIASLALVLFISKSIFASLLMKYMTVRFAKSESKIATSVYLRILNSPISKVSTISKSEIVYALTYSAGFAITQTLTVMVIIFSELFLLVFISAVFAFVDLQLTLYIILYFAMIGALIYRTIGSQFAKAGKKYASSAVSSSTTVEDSIATFREIFALEKQNDFELKFAEARSVLAKSTASINFLSGLPRYIVESALMVGAIGLAAFTLRTGDPAAAAGTLGIFLTGGLRIMASMLPLQNSLGTLKQLTAQADSFLRLAQAFPNALEPAKSGIDNKSVKIDLEPIAVEIDRVSFVYEGADLAAVKNVSISISKGSTVAFIGQSGSGKSTLADLIAGLLAPTSGTVVLTNNDSRNIGYVPQTPGIVSGTISQNITLDINNKSYDLERLKNALALSHLHELIETLENGADTELGAQSDGLSGGQLQRIGLARAIYANPGLLVLDEATSALDAETEAAVSDSLRTLHGKCTTIVIAHRLTTVQNVDTVFVFDKGEIVASGKFNDLVATNDIVSRFVELSNLEITDKENP